MKKLILASASPRRRELLANAGFSFEIQTSDVPENEDPHGNPREMVLENALAKARAVAAKSAVPALEGLLIEATHLIRVSGYDLKTGITTEIPADIAEPGSIVLNARLFGEIIRKLPNDIVTVKVNDSYMVEIECGMSHFSIMGTSAADYPDIPAVDYQSSIRISEKLLKSMISQTNFAVSDNESRPIHTGSLFEVENGLLTIVAVDGYRLALRQEELAASNMNSSSFVVPGAALAEVEKIAGDS